MTSSLFPDVNVWLALTYSRHAHHSIASRWFDSQDQALFFCRFTQLGLLRLLTTSQVMGSDVMSQRAAWQAYRRWFQDQRIEFLAEPGAADFDRFLEQFSARAHPAPKVWADAYLAAFARSAGLTLVTFDQAMRAMTSVDVMLLPAG